MENTERPLFIDAVRFNFASLVLFNPVDSEVRHRSIAGLEDGEGPLSALCRFQVPLPEHVIPSATPLQPDELDRIIDYWIDEAALPLLAQCVDAWEALPFDEANQALADDAQAYIQLREQMCLMQGGVRLPSGRCVVTQAAELDMPSLNPGDPVTHAELRSALLALGTPEYSLSEDPLAQSVANTSPAVVSPGV